MTSGSTWLRKSGSVEIANRLIDAITDRFFTLAGFPYVGRSREQDFGPGCRSLSVGEYVIVYCVENEDALLLRVVHGRRQLDALFGHRGWSGGRADPSLACALTLARLLVRARTLTWLLIKIRRMPELVTVSAAP